MFNLKNNKNEIIVKKMEKLKSVIDLVIEKLSYYLCLHIENQINAGADLVQIFDSWAGLLDNQNIYNFCYKPNLQLVNFCKLKKIPVICFPKGIDDKYKDFCNLVKPDGISLDYEIDPAWAKKNLSNITLQGGMNPKILLKTEREIYDEAEKFLDIFKDVPYIFNLGHGSVPETDPDKVEKLIKFIRKHK
jgi:uroporphyrinogen decarboxylase